MADPQVTDRSVVIGIDFGTLSGRAVVVRVRDGRQLGSAVHTYAHGVIDTTLPSSGERLPKDWALQVPADYIDVLRHAVPDAVRESGVDVADVIAVATDFTACTMLPTTADGTPLNEIAEFADRPHAYVKLWKHHSAQPQADRINALAHERGEPWIERYGGKLSSEWELAKGLQLFEEDPEIYRRADHWVEAADWIVWRLCGNYVRNTCTAGYKAVLQDDHYPSKDFLAALNEGFTDFFDAKVSRTLAPLGARAGNLTEEASGWTGLRPGTVVAVGNVDAHVDRAGGTVDRTGPAALGDGHLHVPRHERRPRGRRTRHVRRRARRHHPGPVGLRGRPERCGRHLRLVRRQRRPRVVRRGCTRRGPVTARVAQRPGGGAGRRRSWSDRPGLAQRQPVGARRPRPVGARRRAHAADQTARHLPRPARGDGVRHPRHRRGIRGARRAGHRAGGRRRPDQEQAADADLLRRDATAAVPDRSRERR